MNDLILGLVQGLTEFLPVSSSGHLALFAGFFNQTDDDLLYEVLLHLGTLLSVVLVFRIRLWQLVKGLFTGDALSRRYFLLVVISSIPTGIIGIFFEKQVSHLSGSPLFVCAMLLITGSALFSTKFTQASALQNSEDDDLKAITPLKAFLLGIAQGIAVLPGISRSGSTIVSALWLKIPRSLAGEYSFLMSLPVIGGAAILKIKEAVEAGNLSHSLQPAPLLGVLVSFVSGWIALKYLMVFIRKGAFFHFAWYVWAFALFGFVWFS